MRLCEFFNQNVSFMLLSCETVLIRFAKYRCKISCLLAVWPKYMSYISSGSDENVINLMVCNKLCMSFDISTTQHTFLGCSQYF